MGQGESLEEEEVGALPCWREGNARSAKESRRVTLHIGLESYDAFKFGFLLINSVNKQLTKIRRM